jgi:two-component system cell cycle response regulator DivK
MHSTPPPVLDPRRAAARPRKPSRTAADAGGAPGVARSLDGIRVLLVEDDPLSLKLLEAVLAGEGSEVRSARSAEEALEVLQSFRATVAVIDLILPLASGLLLAERLKSDPATSDLVLIAVTAFNGPEARRMATAAGFSLYVRKPLDPISFPGLLLAAMRGAR